jgi:hypothetical protein
VRLSLAGLAGVLREMDRDHADVCLSGAGEQPLDLEG